MVLRPRRDGVCPPRLTWLARANPETASDTLLAMDDRRRVAAASIT
jgi:hypothetical protein